MMEHRTERRLRAFIAGLALGGLLFGGGVAAVGLARWDFALRTYGPAVVLRLSAAWLIAGTLLLLVGLLASGWLFRWNWLRVTTFQNGLQHQTQWRSRTVTWSEIRGVTVAGVRYGLLGLAWGSRSRLTLELEDGHRLRLSDTLAGLSQLTSLVKRRTYPRLLTEYTASLRDGQPIRFGRLSLRPEGVQLGRRRVSWGELESAELREGRMVIKLRKPGSKLRLHAGTIPNVEICLQLVQHYASRAGGGPQPPTRE